MFLKKRLLISGLLTAFLLIFALFYLKYLVVGIEDRVKYLKMEIKKENTQYHVLSAEHRSMVTPARLRGLYAKHLKLQKVKPENCCTYDDFIKNFF